MYTKTQRRRVPHLRYYFVSTITKKTPTTTTFLLVLVIFSFVLFQYRNLFVVVVDVELRKYKSLSLSWEINLINLVIYLIRCGSLFLFPRRIQYSSSSTIFNIYNFVRSSWWFQLIEWEEVNRDLVATNHTNTGGFLWALYFVYIHWKETTKTRR